MIQHAYTSKNGPIDIAASADGGAITVGVRDFGVWMPEASKDDGANRGLLLMRGLMDSVDIFSGPEGTNVLMRRQVGGVVPRG